MYVMYGIIKGQQKFISVVLRSSAPNALDFMFKMMRDIVSSEIVVNEKEELFIKEFVLQKSNKFCLGKILLLES